MTTQDLRGARYLHIAIPYDREWDEYHLITFSDGMMDELETEEEFEIPNYDKENKLMNFTIDLQERKVVDWSRGEYIRLWGKICDEGTYTLLDGDRKPLWQITGYVPNKLVPPLENGWGDYIELAIEADGKVEEWPVELDFSEFVEKGHEPKPVRSNKYRKAESALLSLYSYHLTDDEKCWLARQLTEDMVDLRRE